MTFVLLSANGFQNVGNASQAMNVKPVMLRVIL